MPLPATFEEINRSERFFCAALFEVIRNDPIRFLVALQKCALIPPDAGETWSRLAYPFGTLDTTKTWDSGFEVCLFRDVLKFASVGLSCKQMGYSAHTVFDLAFASDEQFVVLEAKGFESFSKPQSGRIDVLRKQVARLLSMDKRNVFFLGLISSKYYGRIVGNNHQGSMANFDGVLSWLDLAKEYPGCTPLLRAEAIYM